MENKYEETVLLDTNFILTCLKQKINFADGILFMGKKILIPRQVVDELKILEKKGNFNAGFALKFIEKNKFKKIDLKDKKTDRAVIKFAKKNSGVIIATLDREIKKKVENRKMVIKGKKKLEIV